MIRDNTFNQKYLFAKENIVPKLFSLAYYFIAIVLLFSGTSKIIDPEDFLNVLNVTLSFLGENTIVFIATSLPLFEIALGTMIILKIKLKETFIAVFLLFAGFAGFAIYGAFKGFNIDCGCFGSNVSSEFGVLMIVRNIVLVVIAFFLFNYNKGHLNFEN